ncbi:helix-turn-helix domain-containing protein [Rubripirellula reticaptiva]|uniref:DNA-binding protein Fis n=1 Tax=Rubripirellula reticaptiva TaxID=2528013 RepID=A0A5C6EGZ7_9BACT|nr:helix-turn-helix domain-containing protein [Rubripirellula reticaptiva]TWU46991.1 DNA-binding protein Fis [Rubripirellula reticaptiva]
MQLSNDVTVSCTSGQSRAVSNEQDSFALDPWEQGLINEVRRLFAGESQVILEQVHERVDRVVLDYVLAQTSGNISQASKRLGVSRPTLRNRSRALGLYTQPTA